MAALDLEEVVPDRSIAELEKAWGISRNALKARARALGVELIRQGPTLTVWPGDRLHDAERLDAHLKAGGAMAAFPAVQRAISDGTTPAPTPKAGMVKAPMNDLAALVSAISQVAATPAADPLARARGLAEAADVGLVLANEDMAALLGHGVSSWRDGHEAYGYSFSRHQQGRQVLWTVARAISASARPALTAAVGTRNRRVGFASTEVVEARIQVLGNGAALFAANAIS